MLNVSSSKHTPLFKDPIGQRQSQIFITRFARSLRERARLNEEFLSDRSHFLPVFVSTELWKKSLLKKSNEPTKPTRALFRAWRTEINKVRLPTVAGYYGKTESVDRSRESEECLLQSMLVLRDSLCRNSKKQWEHRVTMDSLDRQKFYSEEGIWWMERAFEIRLPDASEEEWKTSLFASTSDEFCSQEIVRTGDNQRVLKRSSRFRFLNRNRASLLGHCRWHRSWDDRWQHSYHQRIRHHIHQRTHARHHLYINQTSFSFTLWSSLPTDDVTTSHENITTSINKLS